MDGTLYMLIAHPESFTRLLNQVTAVLTRRQINVESLNASTPSIRGVHEYTITTWTDRNAIEKVVRQIEKKIGVLQAHYFTEDEIYFHEIAPYKASMLEFQSQPEVSKVIRRYDTRIVEIGPIFAIIEKDRISEEVTSLYEELSTSNCVLQSVHSGQVAITTNCFERVNEFLADRETRCNLSKGEGK